MKIDLTALTAKVLALESTINQIRKNNPTLIIPTQEEFEKNYELLLKQLKEKSL